MSRVRPETPSRAQQNAVGIPSTNPAGRGLATGTGDPRTIPAGGMRAGGIGLKRTVAFIGLSGGVSMRTVSWRGPSALEKAAGARKFGRPGFNGRAGCGSTCRGGATGRNGGPGGGVGTAGKGGAEEGIAAADRAAAGLFGEGGRMGGLGGDGAGFDTVSVRPGGDGATVGGRIAARGFGVAADGGPPDGRGGLAGASVDMAAMGDRRSIRLGGAIGFAAGGGIVAADCVAAGLSVPAAAATESGGGAGISGLASFTSSRGGDGLPTGGGTET